MGIDRREALRIFLAGGAGLVLDPERLFWTPKTMITVPAILPVNFTLVEWARRLDAGGQIPGMIEMLNEANSILFDVDFEGFKPRYQS